MENKKSGWLFLLFGRCADVLGYGVSERIWTVLMKIEPDRSEIFGRL